MTNLIDLPEGTKLLCIKGFVHEGGSWSSWSGVRRLTQGKYYYTTGSKTSLGITKCDAGKECYWGDGAEHFVVAESDVFYQQTPVDRFGQVASDAEQDHYEHQVWDATTHTPLCTARSEATALRIVAALKAFRPAND